VEFTRRGIEEQARLSQGLRTAIQGSPEYARALAAEEVYSLDTGDGAALVFFGDPISAAQFAVELRSSGQMDPDCEVRIGINSGPVARTKDLSGKPNVTGAGINVAQRTMECARPGQVLMSETYAEFLSPFEEWAGRIHRVGEFPAKHDLLLRLCELRLELKPKLAANLPRTKLEKHAKVAIIYKRSARPDDELLAYLEQEMVGRGAAVFIDRHLSVGVEWALEIEKQIRSADAVIALISAKSVNSEMLEYELRTALDEMEQRGKPRILPVRVQFTDPVEGELGKILDRFHYTIWNGPESNAQVIETLVRSLNDAERPPRADFKLETPGGAMSAASPFYIERPTDLRFLEAIRQQDSIVLIKGARQMGKTSLLARGVSEVQRAGARVVLTDFQVFNETQLASPETLYKSLMQLIAFQLKLRINVDEHWSQWLGPNMNFEQFMQTEVLESVDQPVVWALDEVDRLFTREYSSEVFGLFRSWHNRRQLDPHGPWSKLTMVIAYATEAHLFITDLHQSPFNVGTRLELSDFTIEQVGELNKRYGEPLKSREELERFYALVGGQPYLVRRGLDDMVRGGVSLEALIATAEKDEGPFGDHLRRILVSILNAKGLEAAVRSVLEKGVCPDEESFYRLRTAGLVTGSSAASLKLRCNLYQAYLARHLQGA
jgi:hypothetical protein